MLTVDEALALKDFGVPASFERLDLTHNNGQSMSLAHQKILQEHLPHYNTVFPQIALGECLTHHVWVGISWYLLFIDYWVPNKILRLLFQQDMKINHLMIDCTSDTGDISKHLPRLALWMAHHSIVIKTLCFTSSWFPITYQPYTTFCAHVPTFTALILENAPAQRRVLSQSSCGSESSSSPFNQDSESTPATVVPLRAILPQLNFLHCSVQGLYLSGIELVKVGPASSALLTVHTELRANRASLLQMFTQETWMN